MVGIFASTYGLTVHIHEQDSDNRQLSSFLVPEHSIGFLVGLYMYWWEEVAKNYERHKLHHHIFSNAYVKFHFILLYFFLCTIYLFRVSLTGGTEIILGVILLPKGGANRLGSGACLGTET